MRYWIVSIVISFLTLISLPSNAQWGPIGYIGLFADGDHTIWCVQGEGFYPVEVWVWCLPGQNGMICAEFDLEYPSNIIASTVTANPIIPPIVVPPPEGGYSLCFSSCQWDWIWIFHQALYVTDSSQSNVEIVPCPCSGAYQFANCLDGFPTEACIKYTNLFINYNYLSDPECTVTSVEEASWGAIKSLYR
jgi:hypothetical protein